MMNLAVFGYGNLGRSLEERIAEAEDATLVGIFSRRASSEGKTPLGNPLYPASALAAFRGGVDCLLLCAASDGLPEIAPKLARDFSCVDAFDDHAAIPAYRRETDAAARENRRVFLIGCGWDPGLFSVARIYAEALSPSAVNTLYGEGVSQGHSAAARHIPGVIDARAYTIPTERALSLAAQGLKVPKEERHLRRVFVLAREGEDRDRIRRAILAIPDYFAGENTEVIFETREAFALRENALPHRGEVSASFAFGENPGHGAFAKCSLTLGSNPDFTAAVMLASARAAIRLFSEKRFGAFAFPDVPPSYFLPQGAGALI